jgi:hypothetical protein
MRNIGRFTSKTATLNALFGIVLLCCANAATAQLVQKQKKGPVTSVVNWQQGYAETTARGTARFTGNIVQEELMALEAARIMAKAGLVELLQGIRVTGATTVGEFMTRDSSVRIRFSGILKGAIPTGESVEWVNDKSAERGKVPLGHATFRICLFHDEEKCKKLTLAVVDLFAPPPELNALAPPAAHRRSASRERSTAVPQKNRSHAGPVVTGLIVDLGNRLFLPVLSPEIVSEDGKPVFNMAMVTRRHVTGNSTVRYTAAVENAHKMALVGANPLTVQAVDITDDNRIVVSTGEATKITKAIESGTSFLAEGRVVIALD